jgi:ribosomal protein S18 acetylase RimI-like enzyme
VDVVLVRGEQWPDEVDGLLRELPEWFGIEQSIRDYVDAARVLPTVAARVGNAVAGVCLVRRHNDLAAEIELLAVDRSMHRQGIGRGLVAAVVDELAADGVELLQVKTRGPSGISEPYARTRAFYRALGFVPLEERTDIWGPENPCLILVKPLVGSAP